MLISISVLILATAISFKNRLTMEIFASDLRISLICLLQWIHRFLRRIIAKQWSDSYGHRLTDAAKETSACHMCNSELFSCNVFDWKTKKNEIFMIYHNSASCPKRPISCQFKLRIRWIKNFWQICRYRGHLFLMWFYENTL